MYRQFVLPPQVPTVILQLTSCVCVNETILACEPAAWFEESCSEPSASAFAAFENKFSTH